MRIAIRALPPIGEDPINSPITMNNILSIAQHDKEGAAELYQHFLEQQRTDFYYDASVSGERVK